MNRGREYLGFSVQFFGLGYIGLWPLSTLDGGSPFGASLVCGGAFHRVCSLPHVLQFGIGLHAFGALCALLALLNLAVSALPRLRRPPSVAAEPIEPAVDVVVTVQPVPKRRRRPLPPPRKVVHARAQFGLRGLPR